jgi:FAD/FMN-containing dehydrogenase
LSNIQILEPFSYDEVSRVFTDASKEKRKISVRGLDSNQLKMDADEVLSLRNIKGILEFSEADQYVKVRAGTSFEELQSFLFSKGYMIPHMYWGSVGGLFSLNLPSPYSTWFGLPKDILLGATISTGLGEIIRSGGVTTKFSSGYKIWKVLSGSLGKLGVYLDVTIKVIKRPESIKVVKVDPKDSFKLAVSGKRPWGVVCDSLSEEIQCYAVFGGFKDAVDEVTRDYSESTNGMPLLKSTFILNSRLGDELALLSRVRGLAFLGTGTILVDREVPLRLTRSFEILKKALDPASVLV